MTRAKGCCRFRCEARRSRSTFRFATNTQAVIDQLNEFVVSVGGRVYLAKDAFTRADHYRAMEPRLDAWTAIRRRWDPAGRLRSAQSVRLLGDAP